MMNVTPEQPWLWAGLFAYGLATLLGIVGVARGRPREGLVLTCLLSGVALIAMAITERWLRQGHGPFVNLFELLMSQLFSLGLLYSVVYWRMPVLRPTVVVVMPVIWILGSWVLFLEPNPSHLPPTYTNSWLWAHVGVGKVFLAFALVGVGVGGVNILRRWPPFSRWFAQMPGEMVLDRLAWQFMLAAFVFDSLMLIFGAVWAQDAWGRYWSWDALETSAFLTWLLLGMSLHIRFTYRVPGWLSAWAMIAVFVMAFSTYFGAPFLSPAAHKGMI